MRTARPPIAYADPTGRLAMTVAWGQNQEIDGNLDGYLLEGVLRQASRQAPAWYGRAELVTKDILGAGGRHPPGFTHFHPLSRVGALTPLAICGTCRPHARGCFRSAPTRPRITSRKTCATTTARPRRFTCSCGTSPRGSKASLPRTIIERRVLPVRRTTSGLSTLKKDQIAERGARLARRDDREYREYLREEQRRQPGCPAREVVLVQRGQATSLRHIGARPEPMPDSRRPSHRRATRLRGQLV